MHLFMVEEGDINGHNEIKLTYQTLEAGYQQKYLNNEIVFHKSLAKALYRLGLLKQGCKSHYICCYICCLFAVWPVLFLVSFTFWFLCTSSILVCVSFQHCQGRCELFLEFCHDFLKKY